MSFVCPGRDCTLCPRLVEFRTQNRAKFPTYYNGPVPPFGPIDAEVLIAGLAPGLNGANQTARPFTNDYAGDVLYPILKKFGLAKGDYQKRKDDGFELLNVRETNSVRCVPPENKPTGEEVRTCGQFLTEEVADMKRLKLILALGSIAHGAILSVLGYKKAAFKFKHGAVYHLDRHNLLLVDSYHTSRYNINTGVLTYEMFEEVIAKVKELLAQK